MGGETITTVINPREWLPPWVWELASLWRMFQGGMGGVGHLPDPGGTLDQPAILIDAFGVMSSVEAELRKR